MPCPVPLSPTPYGSWFLREKPSSLHLHQGRRQALWIDHQQHLGLRNVPADSAKIYPPSSVQAHLGKNLTYSPFPSRLPPHKLSLALCSLAKGLGFEGNCVPFQIIFSSSEPCRAVIIVEFVIYIAIISIAIETSAVMEMGFVFQWEKRNSERTSGPAPASDRYIAKQTVNCFHPIWSHKHCFSLWICSWI